jgi:hypothetical protein
MKYSIIMIIAIIVFNIITASVVIIIIVIIIIVIIIIVIIIIYELIILLTAYRLSYDPIFLFESIYEMMIKNEQIFVNFLRFMVFYCNFTSIVVF